MKFLLTIVLLALSTQKSVFAQQIEESNPKKIEVLNSTYPNQSIVFECSNQDCDRLTMYLLNSNNIIETKFLNLAEYYRKSQLDTGKFELDVNCNGFVGDQPGVPCFGLTRLLLKDQEVKKLFSEGRAVKAVLKILVTPFAISGDLLVNATILIPLFNILDSIQLIPDTREIDPKTKVFSRKMHKKYSRIVEKLENAQESGVIEVNDRKFDKLRKKIFGYIRGQ